MACQEASAVGCGWFMFSDSRSRILRRRLALSEFRQTFRATRCSHAATVGRERRLLAFFHSTTKTAWAASSASASWASIRRHSLKTRGPWRRTSSSNAVSEELSTTTANNCPSCRESNGLTSVRTACDGLFVHSNSLSGEVRHFSKKSRNPSAGHGTYSSDTANPRRSTPILHRRHEYTGNVADQRLASVRVLATLPATAGSGQWHAACAHQDDSPLTAETPS